VLRGMFIAMSTCIRKKKKNREISNKAPNIAPQDPLQGKAEPKIKRRKEAIKIRVEINEIDQNVFKESMEQKFGS
jgi:hypothetical protein